MTEQELQAIAEREKAATPLPWVFEGCESQDENDWRLNAPNAPAAHGRSPSRVEDWQFIANARSDVPALLAEVRRLQGLIKQAEWDGHPGWDENFRSCPWCGASGPFCVETPHDPTCPAFPPSGATT